MKVIVCTHRISRATGHTFGNINEKNLASVYILIPESVPLTEDILQSSFSTFTAKRW